MTQKWESEEILLGKGGATAPPGVRLTDFRSAQTVLMVPEDFVVVLQETRVSCLHPIGCQDQ